MLQTRKLLTTLVLAGGLSLIAVPAAPAGLIPNKVTHNTQTTDGNWNWSYNVVVTSDVYIQPGDYFTIYDFAGAIAGRESMPANWSMTAQNVGVTPTNTLPADAPDILNYTFTYHGPRIDGAFGLGDFTLVTPNNVETQSDFTSTTSRQDNDRDEHNITHTVVPVAAAARTPEPATLALCAAALPAALLRLRRRRR